MSDFTGTDVIAKVRSLAEARPEFVYEPPAVTLGPTCLYVHNTDDGLVGGCIVGVALIALGMDPKELHEYDLSDGANASKVVREVTGENAGSILRWLDSVQRQQDGGKEWSLAVAHADQYETPHSEDD